MRQCGIHRWRALVLLMVLSVLSWVGAQPLPLPSGWHVQLEPSLGYQEVFSTPIGSEQSQSIYIPALGAGLRAGYLFSERVGAYVGLAYQAGMRLESGALFPFVPNPSDPFGWHSQLGVGLSYQLQEDANQLGVVLHAQLHYNLSEQVFVGVRYNHRPILSPRWAQAYDIGLVLGMYLRE